MSVKMNRWNKELKVYLQIGEYEKFREDYFTVHPFYQAAFFSRLYQMERMRFYKVVEPKEFRFILPYISPMKQKQMMYEMEYSYLVALMEQMQFHQLIRFLRNTGEEERNYYMTFMDKSTKRKVKMTFSFSAETVGARMAYEYVTAHPAESVERVLNRVKRKSGNTTAIYHVYILENFLLKGVVSLRELMSSEQTEVMANIMCKHVVTIRPHVHYSKMNRLVQQNRLRHIPVVSKRNELLGVVMTNNHEQFRMIRKRPRRFRLKKRFVGV